MAEPTKTAHETSHSTAGQTGAAAAKAPQQSGESSYTRQQSGQPSGQSGTSAQAASSTDYKTRSSQSGLANGMDEMEEMVGQAKQTVNDAYQRASRTVNETLGQAKEYSRENPGTATMVAFGVGVGVGVLLASGVFSSGRTRSSRLVPPVMQALSEIANEMFRR